MMKVKLLSMLLCSLLMVSVEGCTSKLETDVTTALSKEVLESDDDEDSSAFEIESVVTKVDLLESVTDDEENSSYEEDDANFDMIGYDSGYAMSEELAVAWNSLILPEGLESDEIGLEISYIEYNQYGDEQDVYRETMNRDGRSFTREKLNENGRKSIEIVEQDGRCYVDYNTYQYGVIGDCNLEMFDSALGDNIYDHIYKSDESLNMEQYRDIINQPNYLSSFLTTESDGTIYEYFDEDKNCRYEVKAIRRTDIPIIIRNAVDAHPFDSIVDTYHDDLVFGSGEVVNKGIGEQATEPWDEEGLQYDEVSGRYYSLGSRFRCTVYWNADAYMTVNKEWKMESHSSNYQLANEEVFKEHEAIAVDVAKRVMKVPKYVYTKEYTEPRYWAIPEDIANAGQQLKDEDTGFSYIYYDAWDGYYEIYDQGWGTSPLGKLYTNYGKQEALNYENYWETDECQERLEEFLWKHTECRMPEVEDYERCGRVRSSTDSNAE